MKILIKTATTGGKKVIRYYREGVEVARIETVSPIKTISDTLKSVNGRLFY